MADFTYHRNSRTVHEWRVPVRTTGAPVAEVMKAISAASQKYNDIFGKLPQWDDWLLFTPGDDDIVMSFVEEM